jgi:hypothetical protein
MEGWRVGGMERGGLCIQPSKPGRLEDWKAGGLIIQPSSLPIFQRGNCFLGIKELLV